MIIKHSSKNNSISQEANITGTLINNKKGGYAYIGRNESRYQGVFFYLNDMYKTITDFYSSENIIGYTNNFNYVTRHRDTFNENFVMINNSLFYSTNKNKRITLKLDIRKSFDNESTNRSYSITKNPNGILIIHFKKESQYELYLAIDAKNHTLNKNWIEDFYPIDKERKSVPYSKFVYDALSCDSKDIIISCAKTESDAIKELTKTKQKIAKYKKKYNTTKITKEVLFNIANNDFKFENISKNKEICFAYNCAKNSLDGLNVKIKKEFGIFAGLPWFFQLWTRDEAISCLNVKNKKNILLEQIKTILDDGRIANIRLHSYAGSPNGSADGVGWSFFRLSQCKLNSSEKEIVTNKLKSSISRLLKHHTVNGYAINHKLETWMDTGKKDVRDKACIEINALRCAMYKFAFELTNDSKYKKLEEELAKNIKKHFWNKKYLADRLDDFTIRPNLFIAHYVYPKLLNQAEWSTCFENILPALWLKWGGLATIDKSNKLFTDTYSGENPISYHRGDSWYWINNLSAICMAKVDKKKFSNYITKIFEASKNELLWGGIIGHSAELTSAKENNSKASLCQAWSNAMFIELINIMNSK